MQVLCALGTWPQAKNSASWPGSEMASMTSSYRPTVIHWRAQPEGEKKGSCCGTRPRAGSAPNPASVDFCQSLAFSPDSRILAVVDGPGIMPDGRVQHHHIHLCDLSPRAKRFRRFGQSARGHWPVTFSRTARPWLARRADNRIRLWEISTGGRTARVGRTRPRIGALLFAHHAERLSPPVPTRQH